MVGHIVAVKVNEPNTKRHFYRVLSVRSIISLDKAVINHRRRYHITTLPDHEVFSLPQHEWDLYTENETGQLVPYHP